MSKITENSIWPNHNGELGEIKVQIPDGITTTWPEGDALVGNFVYNEGNLVGFIDTKALTENESKTTVMPYDFVDITVDKRLESMVSINTGDRCKYLNVKYDIFLPKGYKRLEYLQSSGTQRILVEDPFDANTGLLIKGACTEAQETGHTWLFSVESNVDGTNWYGVRLFYNNTYQGSLINVGIRVPYTMREIERTHPLSYSFNYKCDRKFSIDEDVLIETLPSEYPELSSDKFALFASYDFMRGTILFHPRIRLFEFVVTQGEAITRFFVPALDPTGAPCMYDIISQEPFYNNGTGQFLYPGAESQVVTTDLDENFYAKMTEHGIRKLYHVPEDYIGTKYEYAVENGFKQLVEPPMPVEGYWTPEWTETDTQLICNWVETEEPKLETL
jgi:hypothetical protein